MRKRGNVFEYEVDRGRDLMRVYRDEVAKCKFITVPEVMERVVSSPARRFYVSEERATRVIHRMLQGEGPGTTGAKRRKMYNEILRRVRKKMAEEPDMSLRRVVELVVREPAPEFYLTAGSASVILFKIRKKMKESGKTLYDMR